MTIVVYCIVRERNRLSIDNIKRNTPEKERRHCSTIRKEIAFRFQNLVKARAYSVQGRISSVIDNKTYQSFIKNSAGPVQEVYCANNILGLVTITNSPLSCELVLAPLNSVLNPKNFKSYHRFHIAKVRGPAGRTRNRNAANPSPNPSQGPSSHRNYDQGSFFNNPPFTYNLPED